MYQVSYGHSLLLLAAMLSAERAGAADAAACIPINIPSHYTAAVNSRVPPNDTASPDTQPTEIKTANALQSGVYEVNAGEGLFGIARSLGVAPQVLIDSNQLTPPYTLRKGQVLQLSSKMRNAQAADNTKTTTQTDQYLVRVGDTLYAVSRQTGISVKELITLNQLDAPFALNAGQTLRLQ
ncbi:MAG: LysM peptidoglycan-binding domain-containing protein, partial [Thiothrix sp.]